MISREIAELTGKRHDHVIRDIRNMFEQLDIEPTQFWGGYRDAKGETRGCFKLNRYYTELLITGYDVKRRAAVIDRWFELEKQVAQPQVPQSFAEALRLAADTQEKLEEAEEQKKLADARRDSLQRTVGTHMHSVSRFARTFKDLNSNRIKADLMGLGYLYRKGGTYRVYVWLAQPEPPYELEPYELFCGCIEAMLEAPWAAVDAIPARAAPREGAWPFGTELMRLIDEVRRDSF